MKRKLIQIILPVFLLGLILFIPFYKNGILIDFMGLEVENPFTQTIEIPELYATIDSNNSGKPDPIDLVEEARKEVEQRTTYRSAYYAGGYPPDEEGVCTDVIWRALLSIDVSLKDLMDDDIKAHTDLYPRVEGNPDPNIDFRRVPNQYVFFERHLESLTTEVIPGDVENLQEWQPGDIVLFLDGYHHVGILSDRRGKDGIPYVIHNTWPHASEIKLTSFTTPIAGHYRWNYEKTVAADSEESGISVLAWKNKNNSR
ncbi:DUF1287 domain-containing protein [Evansella tamaricis]|uniref:DUF1287 domain-containing protein n=1 Tax=Evansella tamaricis TaxID=2069301 RepID=A0ABS6JKN4_9BACI|nr:DUF1287 domain-containing protein [Evansella tamaricis]MBU9713940.1 DUF1287 domain-containing protein [Evansella tamaricis]